MELSDMALADARKEARAVGPFPNDGEARAFYERYSELLEQHVSELEAGIFEHAADDDITGRIVDLKVPDKGGIKLTVEVANSDLHLSKLNRWKKRGDGGVALFEGPGEQAVPQADHPDQMRLDEETEQPEDEAETETEEEAEGIEEEAVAAE